MSNQDPGEIQAALCEVIKLIMDQMFFYLCTLHVFFIRAYTILDLNTKNIVGVKTRLIAQHCLNV